jgi:hypothetical protein
VKYIALFITVPKKQKIAPGSLENEELNGIDTSVPPRVGPEVGSIASASGPIATLSVAADVDDLSSEDTFREPAVLEPLGPAWNRIKTWSKTCTPSYKSTSGCIPESNPGIIKSKPSRPM